MFRLPITNLDKNILVEHLISDQKDFDSLMDLYTRDLVEERYSWALTYAIEHYRERASHWVVPLLRKLKRTTSDESKRNITRSLQFLPIPREQMGLTLELCYGLLCSSSEKIASRVFAMTIISNIVENYPELAFEFLETLELIVPTASAGIKSRARRSRNKINKILNK